MTKNQILYQQHLETKRANLAQEALTSRRDEANIVQQERNWRETQRHNMAGEAEVTRHNVTTEDETIRHNKIVEEQSFVNLGIQQHQADTARMNAITNRGQLAVSQGQLAVNRGQLAVSQQQAATQERLATETARTNLARETEANRHNLATESIQQQEADIKQQTANTQAKVGDSTIDLNAAHTAQTEKETSYLGQDNVRKWISSGVNVVGAINDTRETTSNMARNYSQAFKNVSSSIPIFSSLMG